MVCHIFVLHLVYILALLHASSTWIWTCVGPWALDHMSQLLVVCVCVMQCSALPVCRHSGSWICSSPPLSDSFQAFAMSNPKKVMSIIHIAKETLTPEQVMECMKDHMSQKHVAQVKEHNYFGVGKDINIEFKHHIELMMSLVKLDPYPKLLTLQSGIERWATALGLVIPELGEWWSKHQAYALFQMLSKARKLAHNTTTSTRLDASLKPLVALMKKTCKKRENKKHGISKLLGPKARKLLRRNTSSPKSMSKAARSKHYLDSHEMDAVFGTNAASTSSAVAFADGDEDVVNLLTPSPPATPLEPDQAPMQEDTDAEVKILNVDAEVVNPNQLASSSSSTFLNMVDCKKQLVLPSGEVVNLPSPPANVTRTRIVKKRPASASDPRSGAPSDSSTGLRMVMAHTRKAAYITKIVEGKPKLLVELTCAKTPKYKEHTQFIFEELQAKLVTTPTMSFDVLKQHALDMRRDLYKWEFIAIYYMKLSQ